MPVPEASHYDRALLDLQNNFEDLELKTAKIFVGQNNLPLSRSGDWARVYPMQCESRRVALRCFVRELDHANKRYVAIAVSFNSSVSPFAVDFSYLAKGILINDQWVPVVKMDWVDGQLLHEFVAGSISKPERFRILADKYLEMSQSLRASGVAHGDLNPTNIFVSNRSFKLIDYDGMYVPGLSGGRSCDSGMSNYQHPSRNRNHFGPYMDNFSDWIHYTTLIAYSADPTLWAETGVPKNYALFQKEDFDNPTQSPVFARLKRHASAEVRNLAYHIERLLAVPVEHVPVLDPRIVMASSFAPEPVSNETANAHRDTSPADATVYSAPVGTAVSQETVPAASYEHVSANNLNAPEYHGQHGAGVSQQVQPVQAQDTPPTQAHDGPHYSGSRAQPYDYGQNIENASAYGQPVNESYQYGAPDQTDNYVENVPTGKGANQNYTHEGYDPYAQSNGTPNADYSSGYAQYSSDTYGSQPVPADINYDYSQVPADAYSQYGAPQAGAGELASQGYSPYATAHQQPTADAQNYAYSQNPEDAYSPYGNAQQQPADYSYSQSPTDSYSPYGTAPQQAGYAPAYEYSQNAGDAYSPYGYSQNNTDGYSPYGQAPNPGDAPSPYGYTQHPGWAAPAEGQVYSTPSYQVEPDTSPMNTTSGAPGVSSNADAGMQASLSPGTDGGATEAPALTGLAGSFRNRFKSESGNTGNFERTANGAPGPVDSDSQNAQSTTGSRNTAARSTLRDRFKTEETKKGGARPTGSFFKGNSANQNNANQNPAPAAPSQNAPAPSAPASRAPGVNNPPAQSSPLQNVPVQNAPNTNAPLNSAPVQHAPAASPMRNERPAAYADSPALDRPSAPYVNAGSARAGISDSPAPTSSARNDGSSVIASPLAGAVDNYLSSGPEVFGGLAGIRRTDRAAAADAIFGASPGSAATSSAGIGGGQREINQQNGEPYEVPAHDSRRAGGFGAGLAGGQNPSQFESFGAQNSGSAVGPQSGYINTKSTFRFQPEPLLPHLGILIGAMVAVCVSEFAEPILNLVASKMTGSANLESVVWYSLANMGIGFVNFILWVFATIRFMMWLNTAYRNLTNGRVQGLRYGGTAFFIGNALPIVNCIVPFLVMREAARASKPDEGYASWKSSSTPPIVFLWALSWALTSLVWAVVLAAGTMSPELKQMGFGEESANWASCALNLVSAILCGLMVKGISQDQDRKFNNDPIADKSHTGSDLIGVGGLAVMILCAVLSPMPLTAVIWNYGSAYMSGSSAETAYDEGDYDKVLDIAAQNKGFGWQFLDLRMAEAKALIAKEDYDKAIELLNKTIEANKNDVKLLVLRGKAKAEKDEPKEALKDFDEAIKLDKESSAALFERAKVHFTLEKTKDALKDIDAAIAITDDDAEMYSFKGSVLIEDNNYEDALAAFQKSLELDDTKGNTYYNIATCYHTLEEFEDARENYKKALKIYKDDEDEEDVADTEERLKLLAKDEKESKSRK